MPDPATCVEDLATGYTIGTGDLYLTPPGGTEFAVGAIDVAALQVSYQRVEHRRGQDGYKDAVLIGGADFGLTATAAQINPRNLGVALNALPEDMVPQAGGCRIPIFGRTCAIDWGVRFVHELKCASTAGAELTFVLWRANILSDLEGAFDIGAILALPFTIEALYCGTLHPTEPLGYAFISQECPAS